MVSQTKRTPKTYANRRKQTVTLHVSIHIRPKWGVLDHSGLDESEVQGISHREGRPKRRRFGRPAHGLRSSGRLRLWTAPAHRCPACPAPHPHDRGQVFCAVHQERYGPSRTLPIQPTEFQYPAAISKECYCSIPPPHHPTQYPAAMMLRSVPRGRRGTREKVVGVWRPTQRASHPRGGASVAECCRCLRGEKEGVEGKRGTHATTLERTAARTRQSGFPPRRSA